MKNELYDKILNTLERLGLPVKITDEDKDCDPLAVVNVLHFNISHEILAGHETNGIIHIREF